MENIILFDDDHWKSLLPLTYTRPIAELRVGIFKIGEKWKHRIGGNISYITQDYLSEKYPINISNNNLVINARLLPNDNITYLIEQLDFNDALLFDETLVAARLNKAQFDKLIEDQKIDELNGISLAKHARYIHMIERPTDIFSQNGQEIAKDYKILTHHKKSAIISYHNYPINPDDIYIHPTAEVTFSSLNASEGPIYIGPNTKVMEGSHIRGPFALCEGSIVKMGAKIYGHSTIGPHSKVGGEISNVVIQGYSNKAHDGYLGNSVIGEWCNLGADTNISNLKNNYEQVKVWDYVSERFKPTSLQFCGLIMGDHCKSGINTMFNTGTVIGVSSNIFGAGYPRNFIPSYTWGGNRKSVTYTFDKAMATMEKVMARRDKVFDDTERVIMEYLFHNTASHRNWK